MHNNAKRNNISPTTYNYTSLSSLVIYKLSNAEYTQINIDIEI
jgi:hypothetical protein